MLDNKAGNHEGGKMTAITLKKLIKERRGYKYLDSSGKSPYQRFQYNLKSKTVLTCPDLDTNIENTCGAGWNLATPEWIAQNCLNLDGIIVEFEIPKDAQVVVPTNSTGKFRTDKIRIKREIKITDLYPKLKTISAKLKFYKPTNPITAEKMPEIKKIKKVRAQVRAQVWISAYYAVKEFMGLKFEHSAFDLIRMGIIIVDALGKIKVFGKNGKFLGEFDK